MDDYSFHLPDELIAQEPALRRGDSRMMLVKPDHGVVGERIFRQLPNVLRSGDLLILNQSRVLPARIFTRRPDTGGRVELLLVRPATEEKTWLALARPARRLKPGSLLEIMPSSLAAGQVDETNPPMLEVVGKRDDGHVEIKGQDDPAALAQKWGIVPLPPYIHRDEQEPDAAQKAAIDRDRYQTVFAHRDISMAGSVAAPTAGLHFSQETLDALSSVGVGNARITLHVGPGTFQAPSAEQLHDSRLHRETFQVSAETLSAIESTRSSGGRVIAVGTTSLRVLETVARLGLKQFEQTGALPSGVKNSGETEAVLEFPSPSDSIAPVFTGQAVRRADSWDVEGHTRLFIRPPERIVAADGLLTNFHLPKSSLLMLVASLVGPEIWQGVYRQAVENRMRFYSYGDCMLILPDMEES